MKKYTAGKAVVAVLLFLGVSLVSLKVFAFDDNSNTANVGVTASSSNSNNVLNANDNSSKNTNTIGNTSASAVNGSVTDNSKTTNTNTALGGTSISGATANGNGNNNGNVKNTVDTNASVSHSGNATQGQIQGQQSSQANGQTTTVNDPNNSKVYANTWPSVAASEGTSAGTASTIFGSLGIADTEKYKKIQVILQTLSAEIQAGLISKEDAAPMVASLNIKLMGTVKTQRTLFGLGPETSGKNLLNVLGLATADSFYKDGDAQGGQIYTPKAAQAQAATVALDNTEVTNKDVTTGNGGNLAGGVQK